VEPVGRKWPEISVTLVIRSEVIEEEDTGGFFTKKPPDEN